MAYLVFLFGVGILINMFMVGVLFVKKDAGCRVLIMLTCTMFSIFGLKQMYYYGRLASDLLPPTIEVYSVNLGGRVAILSSSKDSLDVRGIFVTDPPANLPTAFLGTWQWDKEAKGFVLLTNSP